MIPTYADIGPLFTFVFLTLSTFRITRFITTDDLTEPIRTRISDRFGDSSNWATLITCNWCAGIYITSAVYLEHYLLGYVPLLVHMALSTSAIVGFVGNYDD